MTSGDYLCPMITAKRFILATLLLLAASCGLNAQVTVSGQLVSTRDTTALYGAVIVMRSFPDSTLIGTTADTAGKFELSNVKDGRYRMTIRYSSFLPVVKMIRVEGKAIDLGVIPMYPDSSYLKTVVIGSTMIRVVQKNDTTEMNAAAFKTNPDATAEDLVGKMPGIQVQNGEVKAQGETVQKVLVDGKEYFGDDASSVLRNMPADMVDKVQIFDQRSDMAIFTGVDDGNTKKTLNIITKNQYSNATFGRVYAGYGTDNRYQAGFVLNDFRKDQKITLLGNFNNINQVNFSMQDMSGISGNNSGGSRGGGMMGRGGMGRGGDNSFMVGQQKGITQVSSFGMNYANKWGTKTQLSGSYFFNATDNTNQSLTARTFYAPASGTFYYQDNSTSSYNLGHRANLRLEYNPDSVNSFTFAPRYSYQYTDYRNLISGANYTTEDTLNSTSTDNASLNTSNSISGNLSYRHRFKKAGRTFSAEVSGSFLSRDGSGDLFSLNKWFSGGDSSVVVDQNSDLNSVSWSVAPTLTWTEKAGKAGILSFSYSPSYSLNASTKMALSFDSTYSDYILVDTTVSNDYDNYVVVNKAGVNYRTGGKGNMFSFGLDAQRTDLIGYRYFPSEVNTEEQFYNLLPSFTAHIKKGKKISARINYRTSANAPSLSQLQNVIDNSNPLSLSAGNPFLKQSYSHTLFSRYSYNNTDKARNLFLFVTATLTNNYIGSSLLLAGADTVLGNGVVLGKGAQYSQPENLSGYYSASTFGAYSFPLLKLKSNFSFNWMYSLLSSPGLINGIKNIALSNTVGGGFTLSSNISQRIDFSAGWNANYVVVANSVNESSDNSYYYHTPNARLNLLLGKGFVLSSDVNFTSYRGLGDGFNQDFLLWNASFGYKFAKNRQCEFRITAFDILKQNQSLSRTIGETYIEDQRTQVLQQYLMFTFTWNFKKFRGGGEPTENQTPAEGPRPQFPPGPPPGHMH